MKINELKFSSNTIILFCVVAILCAFFCAILFSAGCRKAVSDNDHEDGTDSIIHISFTSDQTRKITMDVKANEGANVIAEDKDGIRYKLFIPPFALKQDQSVTITPCINVKISGLGGGTCKTCQGADENCCHRGVILEPAGLVFDSSVFLTVQFPESMAFPFEKPGIIAYVDPANGEYDVCPTQTVVSERSLVAKITHFSGYVTDEVNHDRLKEAIKDAFSKLGSPTGSYFWPNLAYIWELLAIYDVCNHYENCSDLRSMIENNLYTSYEAHVNWKIAQSAGRSDCEALYLGQVATEVMALSNADQFRNLNSRLDEAYAGALERVIQAGEAACKGGNCQNGLELLNCARNSYVGRNAPDPQIIERLNKEITGCCKVSVELSASRTSLQAYALSLSDLSSCYAILTAKVRGTDGKPMAGKWVYFFFIDHQGNRQVISDVLTPPTDENGEVKQIAYVSNEFDCNTCQPLSAKSYYAAFYTTEEIVSNPVTITESYPKVEINVDFNWDRKTYSGDGTLYSSETVTSKGTLTHCATTVYPFPQPACACNGVVTRSYSAFDVNGNSCTILPADQKISTCGFDVEILDTIVTVSNYDRPFHIGYIKFIRAGLASYLQMNTVCTDSHNNISAGIFDYCGIHWQSCTIWLPNVGNGNFQDYSKQEPNYHIKLSGQVYY